MWNKTILQRFKISLFQTLLRTRKRVLVQASVRMRRISRNSIRKRLRNSMMASKICFRVSKNKSNCSTVNSAAAIRRLGSLNFLWKFSCVSTWKNTIWWRCESLNGRQVRSRKAWRSDGSAWVTLRKKDTLKATTKTWRNTTVWWCTSTDWLKNPRSLSPRISNSTRSISRRTRWTTRYWVWTKSQNSSDVIGVTSILKRKQNWIVNMSDRKSSTQSKSKRTNRIRTIIREWMTICRKSKITKKNWKKNSKHFDRSILNPLLLRKSSAKKANLNSKKQESKDKKEASQKSGRESWISWNKKNKQLFSINRNSLRLSLRESLIMQFLK